jgi:two-component system sensor histidine kinase KdpD
VELLKVRKYHFALQFAVSLGLIAAIAIPSYYASEVIGYRIVALILLLAVSVLAMLFDILPVLVTALVSALVWNFFFIPPVFTLHIGSTEDGLMALMYFAVALINIVLTSKIRQVQKDARDKVERENTIRLYNTLLNSLSHELRTPIATVIGAVDTLREDKEKLSGVQRDELIGEIEIAGMRLNRQVENLLNMSRLEAGILKLKLDWCDVNELIHEVIKDNRSASSKHRIEFEMRDNLPLFRLDRGLLQQVLHNIIHNAVQHTPAGTIIRLEAEHVKAFCRITISDNGPGFPEDSIHSVFEKFFRLPQSRTGGTGLGLSIAKGFTEAHKGTISLENLPQGGAKFTILIPAEASTIKLSS